MSQITGEITFLKRKKEESRVNAEWSMKFANEAETELMPKKSKMLANNKSQKTS